MGFATLDLGLRDYPADLAFRSVQRQGYMDGIGWISTLLEVGQQLGKKENADLYNTVVRA